MTITTENVVTEEKAADSPVDKRRALGRGLESLLPGGSFRPRDLGAGISDQPVPDRIATAVPAPHGSVDNRVAQIPLDQIDENRYQTRQVFDQAALQELADSIRANGVVQPVVVRPAPNGRYVLIWGERRCRAARLAGKGIIPAVMCSVSDHKAAEMAHGDGFRG